ncbi:hypothetical protein RYX36_014069 [Vicia faba]
MEFIEARRKANMCEINTQFTQINNTLISDDQLSNYKSHRSSWNSLRLVVKLTCVRSILSLLKSITH